MDSASSETETADRADRDDPSHDVGNLTVVALTPSQMAPAQTALIAWCERKVLAVRAELADLETNLELATEHGWKHKTVEATLNRTAKRITYYEKIKAALEAGYLVVPNFPVDLFAVRVRRRKQAEKTSDSKWGGFRAHPELLPAGEGRYVDEQVNYEDHSAVRTVDGKEQLVRKYVTADYDEIDFPVSLVKPTVLKATQRAMALRIFDQMGRVQNMVGRDPIIVGQLLDPRGNQRRVSFFIAWWLDTTDL